MTRRSVEAWLFCCMFPATAAAAEPLHTDTLLSVQVDGGHEQRGVLTMVMGDTPATLVLLFPGDPAVLNAEVLDARLVKSRVGGNPLVRSRNLLVRPGLATVLVDCRSDHVEVCGESYVMSAQRFEDVMKLTRELKQLLPGVRKTWVVGHSAGSLASASFARHGEKAIDGAIHVSTILFHRAMYKSLVGFDFSSARAPQLFIHHRHDPCPGTPYALVDAAASRYKIRLTTITASAPGKGGACGPYSEHGFVGAEPSSWRRSMMR